MILAVGVGAVWTQVIQTEGSRPVAWRDVTGRLGPVLWPRSVTRSFWKRSQLTRFLADSFPRHAPASPPIDFRSRRLVLAAAGPRSSTGYRVEIVRVVSRRDGVHVLVREITPSLATPALPRLTSPTG